MRALVLTFVVIAAGAAGAQTFTEVRHTLGMDDLNYYTHFGANRTSQPHVLSFSVQHQYRELVKEQFGVSWITVPYRQQFQTLSDVTLVWRETFEGILVPAGYEVQVKFAYQIESGQNWFVHPLFGRERNWWIPQNVTAQAVLIVD